MSQIEATVTKMRARQSFRNLWHTDLLGTMTADLPYFCFALWCSPCASYHLRRRALYNDMSRYVCCAGYMPCSGNCGEREYPEVCLGVEVVCCFGTSVQSTRFLLQDEFNIQTTKCDNCIIAFMVLLQQVACVFSIVACISGNPALRDASNCLNCMSNMVYCTVCACMQTQHKVELDKRDGKFGPMQAPMHQRMSRINQAVPPAAGYYGQPYPPAPSYAYPPAPSYAPPTYAHYQQPQYAYSSGPYAPFGYTR